MQLEKELMQLEKEEKNQLVSEKKKKKKKEEEEEKVGSRIRRRLSAN